MAIDSLSNEEKVDLLSRIRSLTADGDLTWKQVECAGNFQRDDVMQAQAGQFTFVLSSVDGDGVAPFDLIVLLEERKNPFAVVEMKALDEGGTGEVNDQLATLYEDVSRRLHRSEEIVRELFDTLDELPRKRMRPPER